MDCSKKVVVVLLAVTVCFSVVSVSAESDLRFNLWGSDNMIIRTTTHDGVQSSVAFHATGEASTTYENGITTVKNLQPFSTNAETHQFDNFQCYPTGVKPSYMVTEAAGKVLSFSVMLTLSPNRSYFEEDVFYTNPLYTYVRFFTNEQQTTYVSAKCTDYIRQSTTAAGQPSSWIFNFELDLSGVRRGTAFWGFNMLLNGYIRERYPVGVTTDTYGIWYRLTDAYIKDETSGDVSQGIQSALADIEEDEIEKGKDISAGVVSAIPDFSGDVQNAFSALISALSYDGVYAKMPYPEIYIPALDGVCDRITLLPAGYIDFGAFYDQIPTNLLALIHAITTISLIMFCVYELYRLISEILTNRKDAV